MRPQCFGVLLHGETQRPSCDKGLIEKYRRKFLCSKESPTKKTKIVKTNKFYGNNMTLQNSFAQSILTSK